MATRIQRNQVNELFREAGAMSEELRRDAYEYFRDITPKRTGNARRNTRLSNDRIIADYPYAEKLDEGRSRQAPKGMTDPTIEYIEDQLDKKIRKIR